MKAYVLPFLVNHQAKFPGDQFQIDGTTLPIGYKNEKGELAFLRMICVLDIYSRKLVGFTLGDKESASLYTKALQMAFKQCNHLPAEILSDNLLYKNPDTVLRDLILQTRLLQVNWPVHLPAHNRHHKSLIEAFFQIFQTKYCKTSEGYVGDRIRAKLVFSSPDSDLTDKFFKKTTLKTKQELIDHFFTLVTRYNKQAINEQSDSPCRIYAKMKKPNVIAINEIN